VDEVMKNKQAIILAQGSQNRWDDPTGIYYQLKREIPYKHWLPVDHRIMLARTIDLLKEAGIENVLLVAEQIYASRCPGAQIFTQNFVGDLVDAIWQTAPWWKEDGVIYLHGDVLFSRLAIRLLSQSDSTKVLLARIEPNNLTGKLADEIFGFYIASSVFNEVLKRVESYHRQSPPKPWVFPHLLWDIEEFDAKGGLKQIEDKITAINDYTDDIDSPQAYEQFWGIMRTAAQMEDQQCSIS